MTNDTTTLNGALAELGETMADNLVTKGVSSADPTDGLTTLAGKILSIQGDLDLDVSATLTSDESTIESGESITLTTVLSASYDDIVDLTGVISNATILFKEGSTTIGTATTNSSGVATATISNLSVGTHTIKAVFNGTNVFENCESSTITVTVTDVSYIELVFNGTTLTQSYYAEDPLIGTNVTIDYGDGTIETGNNYGHTYASSGNHTIKIHGVTALGDYCFYNILGLISIDIPEGVTSLGMQCFDTCTGLTSISLPNTIASIGDNCFGYCTGLTSINLPSSVTSIGTGCFGDCTNLAHVYLNWDSANDILTYKSNWILGAYANLMFNVPLGTKSLYVAKNYPSGKVAGGSITLTADKFILSYADRGSATLSATVLDSIDNPIEGATVEFFNGSTSMGTSTTNSSGVATKSYSSSGAGDISFTAEVGSLVSEIFAIRDAKFYDASSSSNVSKYTKQTTNGSLSYDSTNQCYLLNNGTTNWKWAYWFLDNVNFDDDCTVSAKIRLLTNYNCQITVGLYGDNTGLLSKTTIASSANVYVAHCCEMKVNGDVPVETSEGALTLSTNTWYTVIVEFNNGNITFKLYNGDTLLQTSTLSSSVLSSSNNKLAIGLGMYGSSQANIKDITVL